MNYEVVVSCAVTGAGDTTGKSPHVPVTPKEIANAEKDLETQNYLKKLWTESEIAIQTL